MSFGEAGRSPAWACVATRVRRLAEAGPGAWQWGMCPLLSPWSKSRRPWLPGHGVEGLRAQHVPGLAAQEGTPSQPTSKTVAFEVPSQPSHGYSC